MSICLFNMKPQPQVGSWTRMWKRTSKNMPSISDKFRANCRRRWVTQLLSHAHAVQVFELSCRKFEVNNFYDISFFCVIENDKSAVSERMDHIGFPAVISCLQLMGSSRDVHGDVQANTGAAGLLTAAGMLNSNVTQMTSGKNNIVHFLKALLKTAHAYKKSCIIYCN